MFLCVCVRVCSYLIFELRDLVLQQHLHIPERQLHIPHPPLHLHYLHLSLVLPHTHTDRINLQVSVVTRDTHTHDQCLLSSTSCENDMVKSAGRTVQS